MNFEILETEPIENTPPRQEKRNKQKNTEDLEAPWLEEARVSYCGKESISFNLPTIPPRKS